MTDWLMVVLTAVYVGATILICYFNYRSEKASREQTAEMKRQYNLENRPYITTELIYEKRAFYGLRVTNHGKRIAKHVSIQLGQDFLNSITEPSFRSTLENQKGRECIIGIGQHYDLYFGTNKFHKNQNKTALSGRVVYSDGNETYIDDIHIDFEIYATFFSVNSYSEDLLKEIKVQTKELERIRKSLVLIASQTSNGG